MKKLEVGIRNWFNRRYRTSRQPRLINTVQDVLNLRSDARILFLRQDRIGDVLISTPVIKAVRERYPHAQIGVVLSRNNIAVQHTMASFTNHRYVYQKTLRSLVETIVALRSKNYDVVVDLLDNASSTSSILTTTCGARQAVGIEKENSGSYTICVPLLDKSKEHITDRIAMLLLPFGIDPKSVDLRPHYPISESDRLIAQAKLGIDSSQSGHYLGVNISGSTDIRSITVEKACGVIEHVRQHSPKTKVFVFSAPRHENRLVQIAEHIPSCTVIHPSGSYHEFASLLHEMDALWTPDTSAVHLAAAWNKPCCVLFNQEEKERLPWLPYHTHCEAVINYGSNVNDLSVDEITQAIDRLLAYCAFPVE